MQIQEQCRNQVKELLKSNKKVIQIVTKNIKKMEKKRKKGKIKEIYLKNGKRKRLNDIYKKEKKKF